MTDTAKDRALTCWVVTDGRAGIEAQALGLAEAIAERRAMEIVRKRISIRPPWRMMPRPLWGDPFEKLAASSDCLQPPFPDLWIGCGRLSVPLTIAAKKKSPSTFTVQLQDPHAAVELFDFVIAPEHDRLDGANVLSIIGSTMSVRRPVLHTTGAGQNAKVAVLIGGENRAFEMPASVAEAIGDELLALASKGARLVVTTSRRTPKGAADALEKKLSGAAERFWRADCGEKEANPFPQMLLDATAILVTEDSVNMAVEAAATGLPVFILRLKRKAFARTSKFDAFHESLNARGASRRFTGELEHWSYAPLNETVRAAEEVLRRIG